MIKYQAKIYKDGDSYSVIFPDLEGCFSSGENLEQAKEMAKDALSLYLEEAKNPKWQLPKATTRKSKQFHWITPDISVALPLMLRQARIDAGLTQAKLAKELGMTTQQLQKLETPGKSNPTVKTLEKISNVLGTDLAIDLAA